MIKKNNQLTPENINSIRPGFGPHRKFYHKILGKSVKKKLHMAFY